MTDPRVLILHNRYRVHGGEERAVELQTQALGRAGVPCRALERDSAAAGRVRAGGSLLRGGRRPDEVRAAVRELGANVVHVHNVHPLFGHRALEAARGEGAGTVLHLHNFRLFCSIAIAFRDGEQCFRCHGRRTLPGLRLNCRGSVPESAAYAAALSLHQPSLLDAVDRFVTPSRHVAGVLARLGVPADRLRAIANYVPDARVAESSRAGGGRYALYAGRLTEEKGVRVAVDASARSGVPLRVAGEGPLLEELRARAKASGAPVELMGRVPPDGMPDLYAGATMALVPSLWEEVMPYAALEAMAAGVPVVASRSGALAEVAGEERCVAPGDGDALAGAMASLWGDAGA
ncbi:MAG TPA: glycosyltransferase family 4 protein, partial [Thermoleophilaceae bacterium]